MIKLLSRFKHSAQSEEINVDSLVQDIEDSEASNVSGAGSLCYYFPFICPWW